MAHILVIQFRRNEAIIDSERRALQKSAPAAISWHFCNALTEDLPWHDPQKILMGVDGVILGGSGELYFDGGADPSHPSRVEMDALAHAMQPFIHYLLEKEVATLGICLGHQILAYVQGGSVRHHHQEAKTGTFALSHASNDPILANIPRTFRAQYGHKDAITQVPATATILAHGAQCAHGLVRYGTCMYTTQFHPELDKDGMAERINASPQYLPDGATIDDLLQDTPHATRVLHNFYAIVARTKQK